MELIRSSEYFCHPNLVQRLPEFESAASYEPELSELRDKLVQQLARAPEERTVQIDNDAFYLATMEQTLSSIQTRAGTSTDGGR